LNHFSLFGLSPDERYYGKFQLLHLTILAALFLTFQPIYSLVYEDGGNSLILSSVNINIELTKA